MRGKWCSIAYSYSIDLVSCVYSVGAFNIIKDSQYDDPSKISTHEFYVTYQLSYLINDIIIYY